MGLVAKRDNSVMRGLEFSAPPAPPSREEELGGESRAVKDFISHACVMRSPEKCKGQGLESVQVDELRDLEVVAHLERARGLHAHLPATLPYVSLPSGRSSVIYILLK